VKKILIIFIFGLSILSYGQENSIIEKDSIDGKLLSFGATSKISLNLKIGKLFKERENDSAFYYFNLALNIAKEINSKQKVADILHEISRAYESKMDYENALEKYLECVDIYCELNNKEKLASIFNSIGWNYFNLMNETKAIEYYFKSIKIYKNDLKDNEGVANSYISIGNLYYTQENYSYATTYYNDALAIYKELNDKESIAICYTNLGNTIADSGNTIEGLKYFFKSVEIGKELVMKYGLANNYNNIADCYITLKQYKEAQSYLDKALKISLEINDKELLALIYLNIADISISLKHYNETIKNAVMSIKYSKQIGNLNYQASDLKYLSEAYEGKGEIKKALFYLKQYTKVRDSIINFDKLKKNQLFKTLNDLENTRYTIDELSNKNELTKLKYENEKRISYVLILAILLFATLVIILYVLHTSKNKANNLLKFKNYQIHNMNVEMQVQRDNLKQLNKTKDKLFSIIAHDLKNPFNSIQGFTQLLIENYENYDTRKRLKFLKIIKESSVKASSLLNNLLLWANNQSGSLKFNSEKVELIQQVSETMLLLEIQAFNKEIKILNKIENSVYLNADKNMLNTILRNLISNAIKFTNIKGEIQVLSAIRKGFVEVTIKDNGVGMSVEDQENLFTIDVKTSNMGTANEQGSGFGLVLCKDFVEKHGGKIWVVSKLNEGSEFKFTLPI
jgi:signal transduction histidine kinase